MTTDLFGTPVVPATPVTSEVDLTEVNQKFGNDLDALKKAKAFADAHIKNLETEQAGLRKELETRLSLEQFMDEIKSSKPTSSNPQENHPGQNEPGDDSVSRDEVMNLVKQTINQERTQSQKDRNRALVAEGLQKAWGSSFQNRLKEKAEELGMTREQLNDLASTSPSGFLTMVNAKIEPVSPIPNVAPPRSNTQKTIGNTTERNEAFYSKLRKENPGDYWSVRVQKQMHQDALRMGEEFFT